MARNQKYHQVAIKASSILEVVVAMVITVVVLTIGLAICDNVLRSGLTTKQLRVAAVLQAEMDMIEQSGIPESPTVKAGVLTLRVSIKSYQANLYLNEVVITAFDENGIVLGSKMKIIRKSHA